MAYRCPANILTVGWGSTGKWITPETVITQEEADNLLKVNLQQSATSVLRLTKASLNDNQFAALIDFVFNLGAGRYQASTIRLRLKRRDYKGAAEVLLRYVYGGGRIIPGLVTRRAKEYKLFMSK